jgi:hypothetical protein
MVPKALIQSPAFRRFSLLPLEGKEPVDLMPGEGFPESRIRVTEVTRGEAA